MRRADRLFQLVSVLASRKFATADQLAEALRVSKRTIYRDIRDLEYPVITGSDPNTLHFRRSEMPGVRDGPTQ